MPLKKKTPKAVGFKLFPDHFTRKNQFVMQQLLADSRVKANESHIVSAVEGFIIRHVVSCLMCCVILQKIVLRRENYLGVYISKLRADKTGHYLNKSLDDVAVHVDPSAFQCFLEYYDQVYEFYNTCIEGQQVLYLCTCSPALPRVFNFFAIPHTSTSRYIMSRTRSWPMITHQTWPLKTFFASWASMTVSHLPPSI